MNRYVAGIRQYGTHRSLTGQRVPRKPPDRPIGPGRDYRPGDPARGLSRPRRHPGPSRECSLVILCSHYLDGREVKEYLAARSFTGPLLYNFRQDIRTRYSTSVDCSPSKTSCLLRAVTMSPISA